MWAYLSTIKQVAVKSLDSLGTTGIAASITLNMSMGEFINQWLTVIISVLTITYLVVKIRNAIKEGKKPTRKRKSDV